MKNNIAFYILFALFSCIGCYSQNKTVTGFVNLDLEALYLFQVDFYSLSSGTIFIGSYQFAPPTSYVI